MGRGATPCLSRGESNKMIDKNFAIAEGEKRGLEDPISPDSRKRLPPRQSTRLQKTTEWDAAKWL
jgi:hypothetical protein